MIILTALACLLLSIIVAPCVSALTLVVFQCIDNKFDFDRFMPSLQEKPDTTDMEFFKDAGWLGAFISGVWSLIATICFNSFGWAYFASVFGGAVFLFALILVCFVIMALYQGGLFLKELYRTPWNSFVKSIGKHGWMIDLAYEAEQEAQEQRTADIAEKLMREGQKRNNVD